MMSEYVTGILVRNEPGAAAPGSTEPIDRWLIIQVSEKRIIRVFDSTYLSEEDLLLSERKEIQEGKTYSFLLTVLANNVENIADTSLPLEGEDVWTGTIIEPI
jgi:hypothetical protein